MPEVAASEVEPEVKEHPMTRLKREHAEQAAEIAALKAKIEALTLDAKPVAAPVAPPEAPAEAGITPEAFFPLCVSSLLAGGAKASDVGPLAQAAWATTLALVKDIKSPASVVSKSVEASSTRKTLQADWEQKDKEAQGEMMQIRIKRDAAARTTSQLEREKLTAEVAAHDSKMRALIAECLMIEGRIKAL